MRLGSQSEPLYLKRTALADDKTSLFQPTFRFHQAATSGRGQMTVIISMLERLDMSQYLQPFLDEGFDTWETLMDITESDL